MTVLELTLAKGQVWTTSAFDKALQVLETPQLDKMAVFKEDLRPYIWAKCQSFKEDN